MTVFQRKRDGKYIVQVWDRHTNTRKHLGSFATKREARDAESKAYGARTQGTSTVGDFANRWVQDFPRPADSTNKHNSERVRKFAAAHPNLPLAAVTRDMAREWALGHRGERFALRAMFNDAKRSGFVNSNPFGDMGLPKSPGRRNLPSEWMTVADVDHLVNTAELIYEGEAGILAGAIIQFAAYTGLRPGEIWALKHDAPTGDTLEVREALRSKTGTTALPKNGKARIVSLLPQAREAIDRVPRLHKEFIFTGPTGNQLRNSTWHGIWTPIRNVAKRPDLDFYDCRHYCATYLLELGLSPADVAVQLGHTDGGRLVMEVYGHPSERLARDRIQEAALQAIANNAGEVRTVLENRRQRS